MKLLYQGLLGIARAVVRQAEATAVRARRELLAGQLAVTIELVKRVVTQTRARVLRGDKHFPGKVVGLFEAHTEIIRKGKLARPTEFGRLVKIQEAEAQFITTTKCASEASPTAPSGSRRSIATSRSSTTRRAWPSPTAGSPRGATNTPPTLRDATKTETPESRSLPGVRLLAPSPGLVSALISAPESS
jgi:hypothetical protein